MAVDCPQTNLTDTDGSHGAIVKERVFTDRLLDAVHALRGEKSNLTTLGIAGIQHERKAKNVTPVVPDFGKAPPTQPAIRSFSTFRRRDRVDYKAEVGDLDLNSLAMAVVNYEANRIPEANPCVVRRDKQNNKERDFNHKAASLIRRPNPFNVWANYVGAAACAWNFKGDVHFWKNRSLTGIEELWYLPYFLITARWPNDGRSPNVIQWAKEHGEKVEGLNPFLSHYQYTPPGRSPVLYRQQEIIHLKRYCNPTNPREGVGVFEPLYKELYSDDRIALFTASIMTNMGIQVPVFSPKDDKDEIDPTDAEHMKELWMAKTTGSRAGEPVIMPVAVDIEKFGFSPDDMDLSELRLVPESRVCAVTGIPAATLQFLVGLQNGTSYASSEQARQQGFEEVVLPLLRVWAENLKWQLLSEFDDAQDADFEFDVSDVRVLQEDVDALYSREVEVFRAGGSTYDQFLTAIGKQPVGSPLGDIRLVPGIATPVSPDQLIARATAESPSGEPIDPALLELAKMADLDAWQQRLEKEMREFMKREH